MATVISFADQAVAFLAQASNQSTFPGMVGLAAFAGTSLTRRYGQGGLQVNGVTLGTPSAFRLQELLLDGMRVTDPARSGASSRNGIGTSSGCGRNTPGGWT